MLTECTMVVNPHRKKFYKLFKFIVRFMRILYLFPYCTELIFRLQCVRFTVNGLDEVFYWIFYYHFLIRYSILDYFLWIYFTTFQICLIHKITGHELHNLCFSFVTQNHGRSFLYILCLVIIGFIILVMRDVIQCFLVIKSIIYCCFKMICNSKNQNSEQ